jgi:predicted transcriptional regulator
MELIGRKHWKTFQINYLKPLLQQGLVAMTIPEKPTSSKQRYGITVKGRKWLESQQNSHK